VHEDSTAEIQVLVAGMMGALRTIGTVDRALIGTIRLDPARAVLYVTRSEGGIQNLFAYSLTNKTLRRVSENDLPGVTFSGIEPLGGGQIIGVRQERKSDVWLLDSGHPEGGAAGGSAR
jgi:hypothetical protein